MARKNILAAERRIKEIYERDKSDPELYIAIRELAESLLVVKGMCYKYEEIDEVSHNLASDLYMKIQEGFKVYKWTKYIWLRLYGYRSEYLDGTRGVEFVVEDLVDLDKIRHLVHPQAEASFNGFNFTELESVVDSLPGKIKRTFDKYVRYEIDSDEYKSVWMSVMVTVIDNNGFTNIKKVTLFELDESYEQYVRFMINLISKRLAVYLHRVCGDELSHREELRELLSGYKSVIDD